jgi:hypothetical protein
MVSIDLVSYAYVTPGGAPPRMVERATPADVRSYLDAHLDALIGQADAGTISPAVFRSKDALGRFGQLSSGTRGEFLAASQELADRLHQRMDQRTKRGFFVTLRRSGPTGHVAVLKLDVHDATAAAMRFDDEGEATLEAVKDLLDIPGELQKGALFPDSRSGSDVIVGDKLTITSLYFLDALDAEQHAAPGPATVDLLRLVQEVAPAKAVAAATALETETRMSVNEFFERHPEVLDEVEKSEVLSRTRVRKRPIDEVDPGSYVLRETVQADGITIRGRALTIREKLRVFQRPGGYRIQIDVDEEPRRQFT